MTLKQDLTPILGSILTNVSYTGADGSIQGSREARLKERKCHTQISKTINETIP